MFQAVVRDDCVEGAIGERKPGGIGLREIGGRRGGEVKISADGDKFSYARIETPRPRSKIEDALAGPEAFQDFVHATFLTEARATLEIVKSGRSNFGARHFIPSALQPAAREIYYRLFRFILRQRFWWADLFDRTQIKPPVPPAILRYRVSELLSVDRFLQIGEACADLIQQCVDDMDFDFANAQRVLDFGCGCGRTFRWLLPKYSGEFHGVDVDTEAIDWCNQHLHPGHFLACAPDPPLPYPADYFDVVYCFSVFTHLNESMQDAWLTELNRILKPEGVLLLTIFSEHAREGLDAEGQSTLQAAGFLHRRTKKLKGLVPEWYQTTLHLSEYMIHRLAAWFENTRYFEVPGGMQDVIAARKTKITAGYTRATCSSVGSAQQNHGSSR